MGYEINISQYGQHYFATHERSIGYNVDKLRKIYNKLLKGFPEKEGFKITIASNTMVSEDFNLSPLLSLTNSVKKGKAQLLKNREDIKYIYVTTDDIINIGDCAVTRRGEVYLVKDENECDPIYGDRKLLATNDSEFHGLVGAYKAGGGPPPLPDEIYGLEGPFISEFLLKNDDNSIVDVNIEMEDIGGEEWMGDNETGEPFWNEVLRLKINNGCVIIKQ